MDNNNAESNKDSSNKLFNCALTTIDNPYNPFTQFDDWYAFDQAKQYYSCGYLARIVKLSYEESDADQSLAIEQAIDEIVRLNVLGIYIKVTPETFKDRSKTISFDDLKV